jgi:hypothetical protein
VLHNLYGIKGVGTAVGNGTIAAYFPAGLFVGGLYIGGKASLYPAGNFFPATTADVGFENFAAGDYACRPRASIAAPPSTVPIRA